MIAASWVPEMWCSGHWEHPWWLEHIRPATLTTSQLLPTSVPPKAQVILMLCRVKWKRRANIRVRWYLTFAAYKWAFWLTELQWSSVQTKLICSSFQTHHFRPKWSAERGGGNKQNPQSMDGVEESKSYACGLKASKIWPLLRPRWDLPIDTKLQTLEKTQVVPSLKTWTWTSWDFLLMNLPDSQDLRTVRKVGTRIWGLIEFEWCCWDSPHHPNTHRTQVHMRSFDHHLKLSFAWWLLLYMSYPSDLQPLC